MSTIIENRKSRWWLWLLLVVLVLIIAAAVAGNRTEITSFPEASQATSSPTQVVPKDDPLEDDDWILGDVQISPSFGALTARILNQTAATRSTYFTVTVLSDGHLVGSFSGAVNNIDPGATATATLIGPKIPADTTNYTYELQAG